MIKLMCVLALIILFSSCVRIPVQSVALAEALQEEGKRMHSINLELLHKTFDYRKRDINDFIENTYTPAYLENFKKLIPDTTNYKVRFVQIFQGALPEINLTKDSLVGALEKQKAKLIHKLNQDYDAFNKAIEELRQLLVSAVKLNDARREIYDKAKTLSHGKIDMEAVESALENYLLKGGNAATMISGFDSAINKSIGK